jgi:hypothetical protein
VSLCLGCACAWIGRVGESWVCLCLDRMLCRVGFCAFSGQKIPKKLGFEPRNSCLFSNTGDQQHQWDILFVRGNADNWCDVGMGKSINNFVNGDRHCGKMARRRWAKARRLRLRGFCRRLRGVWVGKGT